MSSRLIVFAAALLVCSSIAVFPQGQSAPPAGQPAVAIVEGVVSDASQRALTGAIVNLEQAGGVVRRSTTDAQGRFRFVNLSGGRYTVRVAIDGFKTLVQNVTATAGQTLTLSLTMAVGARTETMQVADMANAKSVATAPAPPPAPATVPSPPVTLSESLRSGVVDARTVAAGGRSGGVGYAQGQVLERAPWQQRPVFNTESYAHIETNPFKLTADDPLSTFAADVDTASYTNVRRFLNNGQLPPVDAVRVEELINYFHFQYPDPQGDRPVSVTTEVGDAPWAPSHKLVLVGMKAKPIDDRRVGGRNIVLLIDVSGSMNSPDKLPLVKTGLRMFVDTLRDDDRIAIVVYAGASGLVLPSTSARQRQRIHDALESLQAGGSTNGGQGLILAYKAASENFIRGGVNRVILATDGDFNVGVTSQGDLWRLIEEKKQSGIFLSVLGVGTGNLKDSTMEMLADKGNGHYAYLDSLYEARRVLVREGGATLETVAKDVKFQVEFNPARVAAWRLIGYENRLLAHQDFNNDKKDGGELGAGHTVTVLYEIVPAGVKLPDELASEDGRKPIDDLVYQSDRRPSGGSADLLTVKVRYKAPDADVSSLMTQPVRGNGNAVRALPFASAVAEFGMLLRDTKASAERWTALGQRLRSLPVAVDDAADRQGFVEMVELAAGLRRIGGR
ncbi:MAG TPA: von Willebrand factor type A domain-containing protein [Vicinamibacterales bacterium]|nr:von Willebrand factor type A domain-containing protein [Vicinamibacterales bacterium]